MSDIRMPKPDTIRKHVPTQLGDNKIMEIAEWVTKYSNQQFIKPDNRILSALIRWEEERT